jgi:hypothetical protein
MSHQEAAESKKQTDSFVAQRHEMRRCDWKDKANMGFNDQKRSDTAQAIETGNVIRPAHGSLLNQVFSPEQLAITTLQAVNAVPARAPLD